MALHIVGIGPGNVEDMTIRAYNTIKDAELIVGYTLYNELLKNEFQDKEYYATPMRQERERCEYAVKKAASGIKTVLVCSGDSGIYGMAALAEEVAAGIFGKYENKGIAGSVDAEFGRLEKPDIIVVPGITAAVSGGALLGSPLTCDFSVISLSDLFDDK